MRALGVLGILLAFPLILIGILLWNVWGMALVGVGVWMIAEASTAQPRPGSGGEDG